MSALRILPTVSHVYDHLLVFVDIRCRKYSLCWKCLAEDFFFMMKNIKALVITYTLQNNSFFTYPSFLVTVSL